jgi:hypothetical protein
MYVQWRMHPREGTGDASPPDVGEEGTPMFFLPRFHSTIVVDIPGGRYRAIEYSAKFDDSKGLYEVYMQFNA